MALDPKQHADWEIAQDAESRMKDIYQIGRELGLEDKELLPYGHVMGKVDYQSVLSRLADRPNGKYVDVTAITPTPFGEGKSTTTIGLVQGLAKRGRKVSAAIRQPSGGPTMGTKGSAAGGGLSQCIPLTQYSLGFTGDINAVTNAHNLAMVALTARMQHERNYDDEKLLRLSGQPRLNIDPTNVRMNWVIDFCCQALRNVVIGMGGKSDGFMMSSHFDISVSSEVMAILSVARDLKDMRERLGRIIVAYDRAGKPVTTEDLQVAGAMAAWMIDAIKPNLIQTIEGQPVFVHAGPFANIALGQSSVIADRLGLKLSEYHVTESGFGADIGYEKFWNLKCHYSGLAPDAAVLVATVRALKSHGGAPLPRPGRALPEEYRQENVGFVERAAATCCITSAPSRSPAPRRWCASTPSSPTRPRKSPASVKSARPKVRAWPFPRTGSTAVKARWNLPTPSWTPATKSPTSVRSTTGTLPSRNALKRSPATCTAPTAWTTAPKPKAVSPKCRPVPTPPISACAW